MMSELPAPHAWLLEVVKGRYVGRTYPVPIGRSILGQEHRGAGWPVIDLGDQSSNSSLRAVAMSHAALESGADHLILEDLENSSGTFVNRQRLLAGKRSHLKSGDQIGLGGVLLRVIQQDLVEPRRPVTSTSSQDPSQPTHRESSQPAASERSTTNREPPIYQFADPILRCRSWDEFLTLSVQHWGALRDELTSGRLSRFLADYGRADLLPPNAQQIADADLRLDAWLAQLPSQRPADPELDVAPERIKVAVRPGGGSLRRSITLANVGYRILRARVRLEPDPLDWVRLVEPASTTWTVLDPVEVPVEIQIPESLSITQVAQLVIESDGGQARVPILLEPKPVVADPAETSIKWASSPSGSRGWVTYSRIPLKIRLIGSVLVALVLRLGYGIGVMLGLGSSGLLGGAVVLASMMGLGAGVLAIRAGQSKDALWCVGSGGFVGVIAATLVHQVVQVLEPEVNPFLTVLIAPLVWGSIGALIGILPTLPRSLSPPR